MSAQAQIKHPTLAQIRLERIQRLLARGEPVEEPWFIPNAMLPLFKGKVRYRIGYGGRAGTRSWSFSRVLIAMAAIKKLRILCAREFQNSIEESIHQILCDQIVNLGLEQYYEIKKREIVSSVGSDFVFAGLRNNVNKMKSFEGCDICYIEEAEKISSNSWKTLIPTIRKPGSEIWAAFNPDLDNDPTYVMFVKQRDSYKSGELNIVHTTWKDNPWISSELLAEKDRLLRVDPDAYDHVWNGNTRKNSTAQILRNKYIVEFFSPGEDGEWYGPYFGADWGFSQDPTTLVKLWVHDKKLYIEYEAYQVGCDIDKTPELFDTVPDARRHTIRGDSARPETISYLRRHGYPNIVSVDKWSGSVEDGVTHMRSYDRIIIHPRCEHAIEEAKLYSYKVDKLSGDVLPDIEDKHNHIMDAVRYGLTPLIKQGGAVEFLKYLNTIGKKDEQIKAQARIEDATHRIDFAKINGAK